MDLDTLRMFVAVAKFKSITQAAIDLDISQPALSRRLKGLEAKVGATLMQRSGGGVELTPQGRLLLETAETMLEEFEKITDAISSHKDDVKGSIAVCLPHPMSRWLTEMVFIPFTAEYPEVRLDLITTNPKSMTKMGQCDVMVSPITPDDPDLIARYQHTFRRYFCASAEYLQQFGRPLVPQDLAEHRCITNVSVQKDQKHWDWQHVDGRTGSQQIPSFISTDSVDIAMQWMMAGQGIASLPESQIRHYRSQNRQFELLFNSQIYQQQSMFVLYRSRNFIPRRQRLLVEALVQFFHEQSKLDGEP